jgi:hypothetical protein
VYPADRRARTIPPQEDESALLAVLEQLHDLNLSVETVQHIEGT